MSKTTLLYKDIAPGAALDATVTAPTAQDRSALGLNCPAAPWRSRLPRGN